MPSPRHAQFERTREAILDAAAQAFCDKGYVAATMNDIARAAGYTAPTLYAYFKGKQDILESLVDRSVDAICETFDATYPKGLSFAQRLEFLLRAHYRIAEEQRHAFLFLLRISNGSETHARPSRDRSEDIHERLRNWFSDTQDETQEFTHWPADILATAFTGLSHAFLTRWAQAGGDEALDGLVPVVLGLFLDGVRSPRP